MSVKMSEKREKELRKAFTLFDGDDTGSISLNSIERAAKGLGEGLTQEELQELLDGADHDGDGETGGRVLENDARDHSVNTVFFLLES